MDMDTAHLALPQGQLKNLRLDIQTDDGAHFSILDSKKYEMVNTGGDDIKVCARSVSRGEPDLDTHDVLLIGHKVSFWLEPEAGYNYFAWSFSQDSLLAVVGVK